MRCLARGPVRPLRRPARLPEAWGLRVHARLPGPCRPARPGLWSGGLPRAGVPLALAKLPGGVGAARLPRRELSRCLVLSRHVLSGAVRVATVRLLARCLAVRPGHGLSLAEPRLAEPRLAERRLAERRLAAERRLPGRSVPVLTRALRFAGELALPVSGRPVPGFARRVPRLTGLRPRLPLLTGLRPRLPRAGWCLPRSRRLTARWPARPVLASPRLLTRRVRARRVGTGRLRTGRVWASQARCSGVRPLRGRRVCRCLPGWPRLRWPRLRRLGRLSRPALRPAGVSLSWVTGVLRLGLARGGTARVPARRRSRPPLVVGAGWARAALWRGALRARGRRPGPGACLSRPRAADPRRRVVGPLPRPVGRRGVVHGLPA